MPRAQTFFITTNANKLQEAQALLGPDLMLTNAVDGCILPVVEESGFSYQQNAYQKLVTYAPYVEANCFAEDSGLEVEAFGPVPGIYSARYAGIHNSPLSNTEFLLERMEGVKNRAARFVAVIAFCLKPNKIYFFSGSIKGRIATSCHGGDKGFGYDPVFIPEGYEEPFSRLPLTLKHNISHRAEALRKFKDFYLSRL